MSSWFNPRVFAVATSILVLVHVSKVGEPEITMRNDRIACGCLFALYFLAFLVPLWRAFNFRMILGPTISLTVAWVSVAAALLVDAMPVPLEVQLQRQWNWPMAAFCVAATVAFFLFFQSMARGFQRRDDLMAARGRRRYND